MLLTLVSIRVGVKFLPLQPMYIKRGRFSVYFGADPMLLSPGPWVKYERGGRVRTLHVFGLCVTWMSRG